MKCCVTETGSKARSGGPTRGLATRSAMRCAALVATLIAIGMNGGCGGYSSGSSSGSGGGHGLSASITNSVTTLQAGAMYTFTATTPSSYGYSAGITWSISPMTGAGTLSNPVNSGFTSSVTYQAPATPPNPNSVTITATPSDTRVGPAHDTFTITASATGMLAGQFAFELSGFNSAGETVGAVGSLLADGVGNITGASVDLNRNRTPSAHLTGVTGTYTLGANMQGTMSLATAAGADHPLAFSFMFNQDQQSGMITGSDANGAILSGVLLRQDKTAFSLPKIANSFVFKLESNAPDRLATVGRLNIGQSSLLSGVADESKSGADPVFSAAPVAGRLTSPPDANGRGTLILATPAGDSSFVFYVASDSQLVLLETDAGGTARTRQAGLAERQALPFSAAIVDGSGRIRGSGFDAPPSSPGAVSVKGTLAIQNLSHATLSWDATGAGATMSIDSLRSDAVTFDPSTGRGTIQIANGSANNFADAVAFYLASPGKGFFLDKTASRFNRAIAGDLEPAGMN